MNYSALTTSTVTALRETSTGGRLPLAQNHIVRAYLGQWGEPATTERVRRRVHWITSQVRGPRVLDIGTSGGLVPILLGREGFHVVGVGLDSGSTEWASELLEQEPQAVRDRVQFRNASLLQEDRDLQFDTVIMSDVLEYVSNVGHFIDAAVQHLTSGGRLIASVPFGLHPDRTHKHSFFISDIQRLFSSHGRIEQLSVVDGYIRLILIQGAAARNSEDLPASSLADALSLTEEATLASQSLLWRQLDTAAQQVERLRDEVAGAEQRALQAEEEKQEKQAALEAATGDLSLLQERLRAADTRLQERQQELEELRRSLDARSEEASDARAQAAELRARHDLLQQELREREASLVHAREQQEAAQEKLAERQARIAILELSLAQAASHPSSRGGINETGAAWLTKAARDEAEVAATQQQLKEAERLLAERTAQLEEQKASVAEWVDEYARLEEEKEKAERRAADAEGSLRATGQELLQAQQALVEAEARHEAALAQLDERQLLIEEQAEELKELRGRIEDFEKQLEFSERAREQARQKQQEASQQLSARNARIAELEQRVTQQTASLSAQETDLSGLRRSQEELAKEVRTLRQQLASREKAHAELEQQLTATSAQLAARSHELEKSQAARDALAAEAAELRGRLDAATDEKQATAQELASLKAAAANQLTVVDGERLLWVEPLLELFDRIEAYAHRPAATGSRWTLRSRNKAKGVESIKLDPRKLANVCTRLAKERYRDEPLGMLLLASLADALDPQPVRRKWLGFRLLKAQLLPAAEQLLAPLREKLDFSESEQRAYAELVRRSQRSAVHHAVPALLEPTLFSGEVEADPRCQPTRKYAATSSSSQREQKTTETPSIHSRVENHTFSLAGARPGPVSRSLHSQTVNRDSVVHLDDYHLTCTVMENLTQYTLPVSGQRLVLEFEAVSERQHEDRKLIAGIEILDANGKELISESYAELRYRKSEKYKWYKYLSASNTGITYRLSLSMPGNAETCEVRIGCKRDARVTINGKIRAAFYSGNPDDRIHALLKYTPDLSTSNVSDFFAQNGINVSHLTDIVKATKTLNLDPNVLFAAYCHMWRLTNDPDVFDMAHQKLIAQGDLHLTKGLLTERNLRLGDAAQSLRRIEDDIQLLENGPELPEKRQTPRYKPANNVLYLLHNRLPYNSGGYATRTHGLLTAISKHSRFTMHGVSRPGYPSDHLRHLSRPPPQPIPNVDVIDEINYFTLNQSIRRSRLTQSEYIEAYAREVEEIAKIKRAGIIHAASNFPNGLAANLAARRLGIISIYEVRGLWEITRLSRQPGWDRSERFELMARMEAEACRTADAVITITEALKELMVRRGVEASKITVVPNCVHTERFKPLQRDNKLAEQLGLRDSEVVIGYIGSIVDYEGLDDLLEALALMRNDRVENFKFLLVGDGDMLIHLEQKMRALDLQKHVIITGRVPHEQVQRYYSLVDITPFPRKPRVVCEVVSPLKPFEAMASQKAVVVSSCAALTEIVKDGYNGLVFKKGDVPALKRALNTLVTNADIRRRLAINGREWVVKHRDWKVSALKVRAIYEDLLKKEKIALEEDANLPFMRLEEAPHMIDGSTSDQRIK